MIIFIAAHGKNRELGLSGKLPWLYGEQQADIERLHHLANDKAIILGEKTYHNYANIQKSFKSKDITVLSRHLKNLPDAKVINSLEPLIERAKNKDLWVIGGGSVFAQLLPHADKMYLTTIENTFEADTFFPDYDLSHWQAIEKQSFPADENNTFPYTFTTYQRK